MYACKVHFSIALKLFVYLHGYQNQEGRVILWGYSQFYYDIHYSFCFIAETTLINNMVWHVAKQFVINDRYDPWLYNTHKETANYNKYKNKIKIWMTKVDILLASTKITGAVLRIVPFKKPLEENESFFLEKFIP